MSLLRRDMRVCRASLHPPYAQEIPGAEPAPLGDRLMESRKSPGPATLRHHDDAVIGTVLRAGFLALITKSIHVLLSPNRGIGAVRWQLSLPPDLS
jgi:hypothetical protein